MNLFFKLIFFITIIVIEYLATTSKEFALIQNNWDKLNHMFAFFVLYFMLKLFFNKQFSFNFIVLFIFAIQIELVQYFLPNRYFSLEDIVADLVGICLGYIFSLILQKIFIIN